MAKPDEVRNHLPVFSFDKPATATTRLQVYFDAYGLDFADVSHVFGTFQSGDFILAAHAFIPSAPRGTVLLLHGFLDHTGTLANTIQHLVEQGYAVSAFDLPGHGLSNGLRTHIDDFVEYERALNDFIDLIDGHLPRPYHAVAHSTGAAILVSRIVSRPQDDFGNIVLVAPLVRSAFWYLSTISADLIDNIVNNVPRIFRDNTSDPAFLEAVRSDPMQPRQTSLAWVQALVNWNQRIATYPPSMRPVFIIQGEEDDVVDWGYNLVFLRNKFPNATIETIEEGKHQLLGERAEMRRQVFAFIDQALAYQR
jgi:alpha-beta hydrolase superfamily lysophospholipase